MNWSDGYVADAEYTSHYYAELAPPHLDMAALLAGVMPPDREGGRFRYCELGSGNGMSSNILAACHPNAEFVGIDFMPVHIVNSRKMAKQAGLKNVQFHELSFEDACAENLGQFDYIVAHGIYSWVSPENRRQMVEFYQRFLAPGGLVYLSYNSYPGWLTLAPLQKVIREFAKTLNGPSPQRAKKGFEFAAELLAKNALAFQTFTGAKAQIEKAAAQQSNYLAHEYLNEAWYPLYVTDVMQELAAAKLEYVTSATLAENDLRFLVSDEMAAVIREQPTEEMRQLVKDIATNARFRRDIYVRGKSRLSGHEQRQLLAERSVALSKAAEAVTYTVAHQGRSLGFDTPTAHAIVALLAEGPKTLGELATACEASDKLRVALDLATILCISNQAMAVDRRQPIELGMNRALAAAAMEDSSCNAMASDLGVGLMATQIELALLNAPANFESVEAGVNFLKAFAARKNRVFNRDGKPIDNEAALNEFLTGEVGAVLKNRQATFRHFGLLPA
jgi:SAM-dependent methyltransferase